MEKRKKRTKEKKAYEREKKSVHSVSNTVAKLCQSKIVHCKQTPNIVVYFWWRCCAITMWLCNKWQKRQFIPYKSVHFENVFSLSLNLCRWCFFSFILFSPSCIYLFSNRKWLRTALEQWTWNEYKKKVMPIPIIIREIRWLDEIEKVARSRPFVISSGEIVHEQKNH